MTPFDTAKAFFHACESLKGWEGCAPYAAADASFTAQSQGIENLSKLSEYADWFQGVGNGPLKGCNYVLNASGFDTETNQALFFGTFTGTHTGDGGPVPATGKSTQSEYVYVMQMNSDGKVSHMTKIWNSPWAFAELGWA
ncbi:MAG: hypothetical protein AAF615_04740 [Pseudomonadota bacterium]